MNWEKAIPKPITVIHKNKIDRNYLDPSPYLTPKEKEIKKDSALFRAKIEADLKRLGIHG